MSTLNRRFLATLLFAVIVPATVALGDEPGWSGRVITFGEERERIESTPILQRPYRPLHFYGNTVRRRHYRGSALPAPRDVLGGSAAAATSR